MKVRLLDHAEGDVVLAQRVEHGVFEPALVTELERESTVTRQTVEERPSETIRKSFFRFGGSWKRIEAERGAPGPTSRAGETPTARPTPA